MKKYIYKIFILLLTLSAFVACKEEEGCMPGNDTDLVVTLYDYQVEEPYNPDNDLQLRIATNDKVQAIYIFVEKTEQKDKKIADMGEEAYLNNIVENSSKIDVSNELVTDTVIKGILGLNSITVVGVGDNGKKVYRETKFDGIIWNDLGKGKFTSTFFDDTWDVSVQRAEGKDLYRLKNLYKSGYDFLFSLKEDGSVKFDRQETGFVGKYGMVYFGGALSGSIKEGKTVSFVSKFTISSGVSYGEFEEKIVLP